MKTKDNTYYIVFQDDNDNDSFTLVREFDTKKEANIFAKNYLANLCDNDVTCFKICQ